jgi:hypothetical protein
MSNEENANNTEENVTIPEAAVKAVEETVKVVEETAKTVEEAVSKSAEQVATSAKNTGGSLVSSALSLKENNPKLFYGLIAVVIIPVLVLMVSGGGSGTVSGPKIKDLVAGQKYILKSSNAVEPNAPVRLVAVPGTLAAYDDSEETDRNGTCQHIAEGTSVTALDFSAAYGQTKQYVKVQVEDGPCKGTTAWALGIDVQ